MNSSTVPNKEPVIFGDGTPHFFRIWFLDSLKPALDNIRAISSILPWGSFIIACGIVHCMQGGGVSYLFLPLYHSKAGEGTAAASHLRRALRPGPAPVNFTSCIVGGTVEEEGKQCLHTPLAGTLRLLFSVTLNKQSHA